MRAVQFEQFVQEHDEVEWLIEGLLPNVGWTLLSGREGSGKTTIALQMCDAIEEGKKFLHLNTVKTKVAYVQADSPDAEWRSIVKRVSPKGKGFTIIDVPQYCMDNPVEVDRLRKGIQDKIQAGFVVFDSFYKMSRKSLSTEAALVPLSTMKMICDGKPFLLLHHMPHGEARPAGHNSIPADCSNNWILLKTKLKIEKGRLRQTGEIGIRRSNETGLWSSSEESNAEHDPFLDMRV